jgi:2-dehydropantoate 2-reductase
MRVVVMGAGAMGSVVGGLLASAGDEVFLVGRKPHLDAIMEGGLRISGIWGDRLVLNFAGLLEDAAEAPPEPDLVLITVKSYDTAEAVEAVAPLVGPRTLVCAYQNGLGNAETIAARFGWERTVAARAIFGARVLEPGSVEVTVIAAPTALGVLRPEAPAERVREMAAAMDAAGLPTVYRKRIETLLWSKVAYNCALNPLSALLNVPYGALAESAATRAMMADVIHELYDVGDARGVELDPPTPEAYMERFYEELLPPTAAHYASMHEDLRLGRRTEIDALNGAIAGYGEDLGAACPVNVFLTCLIHGREDLAE